MTTLLHNMSSRPRTAVSWRISPLSGTIIHFDLDGLAAEVARLVGQRSRAHTRVSAVRFAVEGAEQDDRLVEELDARWDAFGLTGAVLVYAPPSFAGWNVRATGVPAGPISHHLRATDVALVLNVLSRTRTNLLLPGTSPAMKSYALNRVVCTDDPRLVDAARGRGVVKGLRR